ncbi:MAG: GTPase [Anaerolineae bacterium]|nr:GTPase [Anaerolineae bacterium]
MRSRYDDEKPPTAADVPAWEGLSGLVNGVEWERVRMDVNQETVGQVALVGMAGAGKSTLLARLRGQEMMTATGSATTPALEHEGFFALVDLVEGEEAWVDGLLAEVQGMDLVVYLVDATVGLRPAELRWISRLRCQGTPLLPVLSKADGIADPEGLADALRRPLATRPTPISCLGEGSGLTTLIGRMLTAQPRLAIPLAREVPLARPPVVRQVVRRAVVTATLLGAQPIPFLDLPLQAANHLRLALRLAAVFGQAGMDTHSRELLATLGVSLGARYLAQQALRLVPLLGWAASAGLAAAGTWALGQALAAYFQAGLDALDGRALLARANPAPLVRAQLERLPRSRLAAGVAIRRKGWFRRRSNTATEPVAGVGSLPLTSDADDSPPEAP